MFILVPLTLQTKILSSNSEKQLLITMVLSNYPLDQMHTNSNFRILDTRSFLGTKGVSVSQIIHSQSNQLFQHSDFL